MTFIEFSCVDFYFRVMQERVLRSAAASERESPRLGNIKVELGRRYKKQKKEPKLDIKDDDGNTTY